MKLNPKQVRLISTMTPGVFVRGLRFVGRESTIQLQETALVVEGNLLKVGLLGIELVYRKVLAEWSSVTIPYSQITRVRYIRFPTLRGLALMFVMIWLVFIGVMFAIGEQIAASIGIGIGLFPALMAIILVVFIRSRHSIDFLAKDGRRTRLQLSISGKRLRNEFAKKLKSYRLLAKKFGHAGVKRKRTGPGAGIVAGLTALLLLTTSALVFLEWTYVLPLIKNVVPGMSEGDQPGNLPKEVQRIPSKVNASNITSITPAVKLWNPNFSFEPLTDDPDQGSRQLKHPSTVTSLSWLEDGRLATGCMDGTVRVWDLRTGRGTSYSNYSPWNPNYLALAPDPTASKKVKAVFLDNAKTIYVWPVDSTDRPKEFAQMSTFELNGALSPNQERLGICKGNTIEVWDFKSQTLIKRTSIPNALIGRMNFNAAGDKLVASDVPANKLILWLVGDQPAIQKSGYSTAVFSPDGSQIAAQTVGQQSRTRMLDPLSGDTTRELELSSGVGPLAFSTNGRVLASGYSDDKFVGVGFWDTTHGRLLGRASGVMNYPGQSAFRADGTALATIDNQEVKVWRTPQLVEIVARGTPLTQVVPEKGPTPRVLREQAPPPRTVHP